MKETDFLKKVEICARYLNQFLNEGDITRVLETIRDLEKLRQHAEKEKFEDH
jgi:hypothetical protein